MSEQSPELVRVMHRLAARGRVFDTCLCGWYGYDHPRHVAEVLSTTSGDDELLYRGNPPGSDGGA